MESFLRRVEDFLAPPTNRHCCAVRETPTNRKREPIVGLRTPQSAKCFVPSGRTSDLIPPHPPHWGPLFQCQNPLPLPPPQPPPHGRHSCTIGGLVPGPGPTETTVNPPTVTQKIGEKVLLCCFRTIDFEFRKSTQCGQRQEDGDEIQCTGVTVYEGTLTYHLGGTQMLRRQMLESLLMACRLQTHWKVNSQWASTTQISRNGGQAPQYLHVPNNNNNNKNRNVPTFKAIETHSRKWPARKDTQDMIHQPIPHLPVGK